MLNQTDLSSFNKKKRTEEEKGEGKQVGEGEFIMRVICYYRVDLSTTIKY